MPLNGKKIDSLKSRYCTKRYLDELSSDDDLDYDPFLKAQDYDIEWLKTLTVNKTPEKEMLYIVSYYESYKKARTTIRLKIIKEKGSYKIDSAL